MRPTGLVQAGFDTNSRPIARLDLYTDNQFQKLLVRLGKSDHRVQRPKYIWTSENLIGATKIQIQLSEGTSEPESKCHTLIIHTIYILQSLTLFKWYCQTKSYLPPSISTNFL